jgi:hypothetical protein
MLTVFRRPLVNALTDRRAANAENAIDRSILRASWVQNMFENL